MIEPVKATATFRLLLKQFSEKKKKLVVIQNPMVTDYDCFGTDEINQIKMADEFIAGYYIESNTDILKLKNDNSRFKMVIVRQAAEIREVANIVSNRYVMVDTLNRKVVRDFRRRSIENFIELNDSFRKKTRNQDYAKDIDQIFSEEHKFYLEDGFSGFSDYSIIVAEYIDSGFAPKAVAIHIVYFDFNNTLRIHHFVSNSNDDISNPAGKFAEALKKLIEWMDSDGFDHEKNDSKALDEFRMLYSTGMYSGLGVVKRLSIKHHLEIMGRFLEAEDR